MLKEDEIVAMAVAAIAEEMKIDVKRIRVVSFCEIQKSNLDRYIEENHLVYTKYSLGDIT